MLIRIAYDKWDECEYEPRHGAILTENILTMLSMVDEAGLKFQNGILHECYTMIDKCN